jgi:hypothetical protein
VSDNTGLYRLIPIMEALLIMPCWKCHDDISRLSICVLIELRRFSHAKRQPSIKTLTSGRLWKSYCGTPLR